MHGKVNQHPSIGTADDHPAERVAVMDPLRGPASLADRGLQGVTGGEYMPALGGCEEIEIFSGSCR
jgi:hypothetical protein